MACLDPSKSSGFELTDLCCIPPQPVLLQASHPPLHRGRLRLGAEQLLPPYTWVVPKPYAKASTSPATKNRLREYLKFPREP